MAGRRTPTPPSRTGRERSVIVNRLRAAGCVFAEEEAARLAAAAQTPADLASMVRRRTVGEPLELILGWLEFCGLRIAIEPGVFVPRRRTEFLVHQAAALAVPSATRSTGWPTGRSASGSAGRSAQRSGVLAVDLCCGSGAVGAALAAAVAGVELYAVDIDPAAVGCARRNLAASARVYQGDLYEPLPATVRGRVDILVANAPYVPTEAVALLPPEARLHEPRLALDGGADGLDVLRRVADGAPGWLAPGGSLLAETSERQASQVATIIGRTGLDPAVARLDELDATVVIGTLTLTPTPTAPNLR